MVNSLFLLSGRSSAQRLACSLAWVCRRWVGLWAGDLGLSLGLGLGLVFYEPTGFYKMGWRLGPYLSHFERARSRWNDVIQFGRNDVMLFLTSYFQCSWNGVVSLFAPKRHRSLWKPVSQQCPKQQCRLPPHLAEQHRKPLGESKKVAFFFLEQIETCFYKWLINATLRRDWW